jgi:hypothetical protein
MKSILAQHEELRKLRIEHWAKKGKQVGDPYPSDKSLTPGDNLDRASATSGD